MPQSSCSNFHNTYKVAQKTGTLFVRFNFQRLNFIKYYIDRFLNLFHCLNQKNV